MEPLPSIQTKDQIASQIRTRIFRGGFDDGEELVQETIANQLGVSRMPVREALQMLEQEGLLVRLPNRHMRVVSLTGTWISQTFRLMAAMTSESALILMEDEKNLEDLALISQAGRAAVDQNDQSGYIDALNQFHSAFARALENPYLQRLQQKGFNLFLQEILECLSAVPPSLADDMAQIIELFNTGNRTGMTEAIGRFYRILAEAAAKEAIHAESATS